MKRLFLIPLFGLFFIASILAINLPQGFDKKFELKSFINDFEGDASGLGDKLEYTCLNSYAQKSQWSSYKVYNKTSGTWLKDSYAFMELRIKKGLVIDIENYLVVETMLNQMPPRIYYSENVTDISNSKYRCTICYGVKITTINYDGTYPTPTNSSYKYASGGCGSLIDVRFDFVIDTYLNPPTWNQYFDSWRTAFPLQ